MQLFLLSGKFSQSDVKASVRYVYSYDEFLKLRHNTPHLKVKNICPLSEDVAEVMCEVDDLMTGFHKNTHTVRIAFN